MGEHVGVAEPGYGQSTVTVAVWSRRAGGDGGVPGAPQRDLIKGPRVSRPPWLLRTVRGLDYSEIFLGPKRGGDPAIRWQRPLPVPHRGRLLLSPFSRSGDGSTGTSRDLPEGDSDQDETPRSPPSFLQRSRLPVPSGG